LDRRAGYLYKLRKKKIARAGELNKRAGRLNKRAVCLNKSPGEKLCDRGRKISGQG
jgi:hypothetical protein